jgi:predicted MFS family arabinose efflux permease
MVLLAFSSHWSIVSLGRIGVLVTMALWLPTLQVYQMENVEESFRGVAYGAMSMAMGLGFATMSYTGGWVVSAHGYHSIFSIGAVVSVIAAALMFFIQRFNDRKKVILEY